MSVSPCDDGIRQVVIRVRSVTAGELSDFEFELCATSEIVGRKGLSGISSHVLLPFYEGKVGEPNGRIAPTFDAAR